MALWDHVQSRGVDSGSGTSATLAFTSNTVAGNILIVTARIGSPTGQNPSVSDSQSNTYTRQNYGEDTASNGLGVWTAVTSAGGANTVTLTNATSATRRWIIAEYSSNGETISVDQVAANTGNSTALDSGSVTTVNASELLIGAGEINNTATFTAGTSFTVRQEISQKIALEDRVVSSTGSYSASMTLSSSGIWRSVIVTLKSAGAGVSIPVLTSKRTMRGWFNNG
jgi:hypothetical protein